MTLQECREVGKRLYPTKVAFKLTTPAGTFDASWLDPRLGAFLVPHLAGGAFYAGDLENCACSCAEVRVLQPDGAYELYVGHGQ